MIGKIELPLLSNYVAKKKKDSPEAFGEKCFVIVLHFLRDLLPFLEGLRALGANPENCWILSKPYPYPHKSKICELLMKDGFNVRAAEQYPIDSACGELLHIAHAHAIQSGLQTIIIEDGGHVGVHAVEVDKKEVLVGAVEQTMKGFWKYEEMQQKGRLPFPVLSVASSRFKTDYEPRFIGQAVVKNIRKFLPDAHLTGKKALVFGYGSIGSRVALYLRTMEGMNVDVCEIDPKKRILAKFDGFNVKSEMDAFAQKDWFVAVGCTGGKGGNGRTLPTVDEKVISSLPHGCILASASSDRVEVDVDCLNRLSQEDFESIYLEEVAGRVRDRVKIGTRYKLNLLKARHVPPEILLLADGYPINFYSSESVPNESIDPIMTTIFLSTVHLAKHHAELEKSVLDRVVDEVIKKEEMLEAFSRLHGLD